MPISVFDLFSIGIGPSSSHTVGPMRASLAFAHLLKEKEVLAQCHAIVVDLYGSLALTGKGHATDTAILLGLSGWAPERVDPDQVAELLRQIRQSHLLQLLGERAIAFVEEEQLLFHKELQLPFHPNGMRFTAYGSGSTPLLERIYYSVGGGFIVDQAAAMADATLGEAHEAGSEDGVSQPVSHQLPYPFKTGDELLAQCHKSGLSIAEVMRANERTWRDDQQIDQQLWHIWEVMDGSIERGCRQEGLLPGGLKVRRRALTIWQRLAERKNKGKSTPTDVMEWVSLWALAVNEENAAGSRVVTAPTNGSAGVIPAVIRYYLEFIPGASRQGVVDFMLTAGAIGILYKEGASISAAEMGCMGEVGVACSMAAAGLTAALGGSCSQIENAAEIGMEHNLGLTCDPIMGLVQIPCIERNTMGAVKAINGAMLALHGDGIHRVSLDQVIATMRQTGKDMKSIYKETSQGGLAVNVPEC